MPAESGAQTQLALLGSQDYEMWMAHSDMYPHSYSHYFPHHPWHKQMWRSAVRNVPVSASPQTKEAILWGAVAGFTIVAVAIFIVQKK